jgi:hypothetical protein
VAAGLALDISSHSANILFFRRYFASAWQLEKMGNPLRDSSGIAVDTCTLLCDPANVSSFNGEVKEP